MKRLIVTLVILFIFTVSVVGMMGTIIDVEAKGEIQEQSEAGVTVKVFLEGRNGTFSLKVTFDTHTVGLDRYRFDEIIVLRADGKEYKAKVLSQEGSGHHRSAVVEFENPRTTVVEVVIKDVAGINERIFKYQP